MPQEQWCLQGEVPDLYLVQVIHREGCETLVPTFLRCLLEKWNRYYKECSNKLNILISYKCAHMYKEFIYMLAIQ